MTLSQVQHSPSGLSSQLSRIAAVCISCISRSGTAYIQHFAGVGYGYGTLTDRYGFLLPNSHYILVCEGWPGATVPLWTSPVSSDARLRRVGLRRPLDCDCLARRGNIQVRSGRISHLNSMRDPPRPASRCERFGCPPPATEFVAQRCPSVVDPLCRKPGSDDIDAVQRKHRNEQMALDPLAQLVPARAQPQVGFERPECGFQFSQSPAPLKQLIFLREDLRHRHIVRFVPPPSSRMFCPTIKPDCCEHRNAHAAPNSCRVP